MEIEIHEFQASILRELLFRPSARFRDLKKVDVTNDHFSFHVNKLVKDGWVSKKEGKYILTPKGKEFANRLDTETLSVEKQAKVAVALHAVRKRKGKKEILIHQRLKQPFYGWYGSHSGKIKWGETPFESAQREFLEETGLTGDFELKGITHVRHTHESGRFLEDKYFWSYLITNIAGELMEDVEEGKNIWMTEEEYESKENKFATIKETNEVLNNKGLIYVEREWVVSDY